MKSLLTIILIIECSLLFAQSSPYKIVWDYSSGCQTKVFQKTGDTYTPVEHTVIEAGIPIDLEINLAQGEFQSLELTHLEENNAEKAEVQLETLRPFIVGNTLELRIDHAKKVSINSKPYELVYPYQLTIKRSDGTVCKLSFEGKKEAKLRVLDGVQWNSNTPVSSSTIIDKIVLQKKNAVLLIDCSPHAQSESVLYRLGSGKNATPKRVKNLRTGDFLRIYLYNLNRYKYRVEINDIQEDYQYGRDSRLDDFTQPHESDETSGTESASFEETTDDKKIQILNKYAKAVDSLNQFITSVKTQSYPSSAQLQKNKDIIEKNLQHSGLVISEDIEKLYNSIESDEKKKVAEPIAKKAKQFQSLLTEMRALSYTLDGTILPIQVKSYDQLKLAVTLKDEKGNTIGKAREYLYKIIGGIKVDQSFGLVGHGLLNDAYALKPVPTKDTILARNTNGTLIKITDENGEMRDSIISINDVTKKEIIQDSLLNKVTLGITTLTHFYYRLGFFNVGPQIGFSVDIFPEQKIRYLAGGSIMFTDGRHRVSIDAGVAFGKVMVLNPTNAVGNILAESVTQAPMVEKTKRAWYIGISYNIPLVNRDTQVPNQEE